MNIFNNSLKRDLGIIISNIVNAYASTTLIPLVKENMYDLRIVFFYFPVIQARNTSYTYVYVDRITLQTSAI